MGLNRFFSGAALGLIRSHLVCQHHSESIVVRQALELPQELGEVLLPLRELSAPREVWNDAKHSVSLLYGLNPVLIHSLCREPVRKCAVAESTTRRTNRS